jgi:iron complex transport system ATP-binding protein
MLCLKIQHLNVMPPAARPTKALESSRPLLTDINFDLSSGEVISIIGANGAGKSTLLKAINHEIPYQGQILHQHISSDRQLRARQLATLPQFSLLNFPFLVSEVVQLSRIPHATGATIDRKIVDEALALMDITPLKDRLYTQLSGGEKQRVQLARILAQVWRDSDANGPRVMLLDEPMTALDIGHQHALMSALRKFSTTGVAIMMVLHDLNMAARYSDKLLSLHNGRQVAFGHTDEVLTAPIIKKMFNVDVKIIAHPTTQTPYVIEI